MCVFIESFASMCSAGARHIYYADEKIAGVYRYIICLCVCVILINAAVN